MTAKIPWPARQRANYIMMAIGGDMTSDLVERLAVIPHSRWQFSFQDVNTPNFVSNLVDGITKDNTGMARYRDSLHSELESYLELYLTMDVPCQVSGYSTFVLRSSNDVMIVSGAIRCDYQRQSWDILGLGSFTLGIEFEMWLLEFSWNPVERVISGGDIKIEL